jgi:uncharacterized membrane protein
MITVPVILKLLHILAAFALVGGEIGRLIAFQRAKNATDIKLAAAMLQMFTFFTSKFVSMGGMLTVLLGLVTAGAQGGAVLILGFILGGQINWVLASLVLYIVIMVLVFTVAVPRGKAIGQALGAALGQGKITPELTAALNDQTLNISFIVQDVLILLIVVLMVLKPF